ncbi:MAG: dihydroorotate dehydrogenase electron transfer subunit, partial [Promethearchaeota archaeon]
LMKCGIGLCGQCCVDPLGYRVCVEGPVFRSEILREISDLGKYRRDFGGKKIII